MTARVGAVVMDPEALAAADDDAIGRSIAVDDVPPCTVERVASILARYTCAGPIPLALSAEPGAAGSVRLVASGRVVDAEAARRGQHALIDVRHTLGVPPWASDGLIDRRVAELVASVYDHERREWLWRDGAAVDDPHRGAGA